MSYHDDMYKIMNIQLGNMHGFFENLVFDYKLGRFNFWEYLGLHTCMLNHGN